MTKIASIASLNRTAAKSEDLFVSTLVELFAEDDADRLAEFFDKMNIPRSVDGENHTVPLPELPKTYSIYDFDHELAISDGIQKFMARHEKKLKWHAQRPSMEGAANVLLVFRAGMLVTDHRLDRLDRLLRTKDELNPTEWAIARDVMNRSYIAFRNYLRVVGGPWIDAMLTTVAREDLTEFLGNFYELVDGCIRRLEAYRNKLEDRRMELTVLPEGFDPVKPPVYFGGDLLGRGPWTQYWKLVINRSHHFRESVS